MSGSPSYYSARGSSDALSCGVPAPWSLWTGPHKIRTLKKVSILHQDRLLQQLGLNCTLKGLNFIEFQFILAAIYKSCLGTGADIQ